MPCRDYDETPGECGNRAQALADEQQKKLDRVTRLLCDLLQRVPGPYVDEKKNTELFVWWQAHQEADRNRKSEDKKRRAARKREIESRIAVLREELEDLET